MNIREKITNYSKGDDMDRFWKLFWRRERTKNRFLKDILTFRL
ncbi:MAG: serine acetyltransferase, partial [Clostridiales bacterium]